MADDNLNAIEIMIFVFYEMKDIVGKEKKMVSSYFSILSQGR